MRPHRMLTAIMACLLASGGARASDLLIVEIFTSGGTGAPAIRDYIMLKNVSDHVVPLSGWAVHVGGSSAFNWTRITLPATSLQPGQYYLIGGAGGTGPIPGTDWSAGSLISMDPNFGRVMLRSTNELIAGACPGGWADLVGWGNAPCFQPPDAPTQTPTTALVRLNHGCQDTHSNAADWVLGPVQPRGRSSPFEPCTPSTATLTVNVTGSGQVTSTPAGVACPSTCSATYALGAAIDLTAVPATGMRLESWVGAGTGFVSRSVSLLANSAVQARFVCFVDVTGIGGPPEPPDGQATVDDVIAFINSFSDGCGSDNIPCELADLTGIGGPPTFPDGQLTVDDIIAFFNGFADGCTP